MMFILFALVAVAAAQYGYDDFIDYGFSGITCGYGPSRILENHKPRYDIETKVAAPVYILPKHGSVVDKRPVFPKIFTSPKVVVKPKTVAIRPTRIVVTPTKVVRPTTLYKPVVVRRSTRPVVMNAKCL